MDNNTSNNEYVDVGLTEEFVLNYKALPPQLDGWRYFRIEYGGCNEACFMERPIYLPRYADSYVIELLFKFWQETDYDIKAQLFKNIVKELNIAGEQYD